MTIVLFFVSMIVFSSGVKGELAWNKGHRHGSGDMRGRTWTGVAIDGRMDSEDWRIGGRQSGSPTYTSVLFLLVS